MMPMKNAAFSRDLVAPNEIQRVLSDIKNIRDQNTTVRAAINVRRNAITAGGLHVFVNNTAVDASVYDGPARVVYEAIENAWYNLVVDMWESITCVGYAAVVSRTERFRALGLKLTLPHVVPFDQYYVLSRSEWIAQDRAPWTPDIPHENYRTVFFDEEAAKRDWCTGPLKRPVVLCGRIHYPKNGIPQTPLRFLFDIHNSADIHNSCALHVAFRGANPEALLTQRPETERQVASKVNLAALADMRLMDDEVRANERLQQQLAEDEEELYRRQMRRTEHEWERVKRLADLFEKSISVPKPITTKHRLAGAQEITSDTHMYPLGTDCNVTFVPTPSAVPALPALLELKRHEICLSLGVPPAVLGIQTVQRSATRDQLIENTNWYTQVSTDIKMMNQHLRVVCDYLVYNRHFRSRYRAQAEAEAGETVIHLDQDHISFQLAETVPEETLRNILPMLETTAARNLYATAIGLPETVFSEERIRQMQDGLMPKLPGEPGTGGATSSSASKRHTKRKHTDAADTSAAKRHKSGSTS